MPDLTDIRVLISRIRALGKGKGVPVMQGGIVLPGQKVQIEGAGDVCVVLRVDQQRHVADLLSLGKLRKVETGISIALLTLVDEPAAVRDWKISA